MGNRPSSNSTIRITGISFLVFLCGVSQYYALNIVGTLYLSEILLPFIALLALVVKGSGALLKRFIFWVFLGAGFLTLVGYMLSDLYQGTEPAQYLRGWARVVVLITDFTALAILTASDRRNIWWMVLGLAIGGIIFGLQAEIQNWKFTYGPPLILMMACIGHFLSRRLTSIGFIILGVLSVAFDSRIQAAVCLLVAAILWARWRRPDQPIKRFGQYWKVLIASGVVSVILVAGLVATQKEYGWRRTDSNAGRIASIQVALQAISESPLIGWGSWTVSENLAAKYRRESIKEGNTSYMRRGEDVFLAHSQLLQAWVEGGILATAFFFVLGYQLIRALKYTALTRHMDTFTPILLYFILYGLWDLVASPFAGNHRVLIALTSALICMVVLEQSDRQVAKVSAKPETQATPRLSAGLERTPYRNSLVRKS